MKFTADLCKCSTWKWNWKTNKMKWNKIINFVLNRDWHIWADSSHISNYRCLQYEYMAMNMASFTLKVTITVLELFVWGILVYSSLGSRLNRAAEKASESESLLERILSAVPAIRMMPSRAGCVKRKHYRKPRNKGVYSGRDFANMSRQCCYPEKGVPNTRILV